MHRADMHADSTATAQRRVDENLAVFMHKGRALEIRYAVLQPVQFSLTATENVFWALSQQGMDALR